MTVAAPRSAVIRARVDRVLAAKESSTSNAATSMITPRARSRPTRAIRSRWKRSSSESSNAVWMDAIRYGPCRRIETSRDWAWSGGLSVGVIGTDHLVPQDTFGLLDAALQITHGADLAQIHPDRHQGLRDLRRQARHDDARAHQPGRIHGLHQVVGHRLVDVRHAG